jgi:hypothetical protein
VPTVSAGKARRQLRTRILGSTSLVCLLLLNDPSQGADAPVLKAPPISFYERFHISLEGGFLWNRSPANLSFGPVLDAMDPLQPGRNGGMAGVSLGRTMGPTRDWRIGWQASFLGTRSSSTVVDNPLATQVAASNRFWFQTFDAEMGFRTAPDSAVRWFLGARVLNANNRSEYSDVDVDKIGNFAHRSHLWGVGPRGGVEATLPLQNSPAFLTVSGSASAIFSQRNHAFDFAFDNTGIFMGTAATGTSNFNRTLMVYNAEGAVALGYRISGRSLVQIGYRAQHWWNIVPNISGATTSAGATVGSGNAFVHGPFGRLTIAVP